MQSFPPHSLPYAPFAGVQSSIFSMPNFGMPVGVQEATGRGFEVEKQKSPASSASSTMSSNFVYGNSVSSSAAESRYKSSVNVNSGFPFRGFNGNGLNLSPEDKELDCDDDGSDEGDYSSDEEDAPMNYESQDLKKITDPSSRSQSSPAGDHSVIAP